MVKSQAATVQDYLEELPEDRRPVIETMRELILENLPEGFVETMNWGMISYEIPLERFGETYNGKPLSYLALAAQKNHNSLYMMGVYGDPEQEARLKEGYRQADKRIDMGKSCVRFKRIDDLPIEVIGELIASTSVEDMIARHHEVHKG